MTKLEKHEQNGLERTFEVYNPDYHLSQSEPLWAATHFHEIAGPPALSSHSGIEVGVVLAGQEEIEVEGYRVPGLPGEVWLCAMSEPHKYRVVKSGTENLVLIFLPSFLGEEMLGEISWFTLFAAPPEERPRATEEKRARLLEVAREIEREVKQKSEGWESIVRFNLLRLLFYLSQGWRPSRAGRSAMGLGRIMPALHLIHERMPSKVSRTEAARECGLGVSRFTMLFSELMGVSFKTFQRRTRVAYAANILLTTDLTVDRVAEKSGFSDASHLGHAFVREYGCTPGDYRKQVRPRGVAA